MVKRLRKAGQGTSSIKSFFSPLGQVNDLPKSSGSSTSPSDESDPEVVSEDSDSDWETSAKRKRPRRSCTLKQSPPSATRSSSRVTKKASKSSPEEKSPKYRGRPKKIVGVPVLSPTKNKKTAKQKEVDLEVLAFLKSGIPSVNQKLEEIRKDVGKKALAVEGDDEIEIISETSKNKHHVEKIVDLEVIAFLQSGVPAATSKAQRLFDIRRAEEEHAKNHQLYPTTTHIPEIVCTTFPDHDTWQRNLKLQLHTDSILEKLIPTHDLSSYFENYSEREELDDQHSEDVFCCKNQKFICLPSRASPCDDDQSVDNISKEGGDETTTCSNNLPWIEKYPVKGQSFLAVDDETLDKIESWLKLWKNDIKDDGGKGRQFSEKKKRKGSDSDFLTSDEESEFKTKSLLLEGPTGTGKTTSVVTLAKKMGFKVVEVNFSNSRSGKEVLKRVEEATLSHRLASSHACLLLFRDICLIEPKEDEGFSAAVAQLITTSCRPIVMTHTTPWEAVNTGGDCDSVILDAKILKKDPLYVIFTAQPSPLLVKRALEPIMANEFPQLDPLSYKKILFSIARHCKGDIRQSINQLQLIMERETSSSTCSSTLKRLENFHSHLCPHVDFNFVKKTTQSIRKQLPVTPRQRIVVLEDVEAAPELDSPTKKVKKEELQAQVKELKAIQQQLAAAADLDCTLTFFEDRKFREVDYDDDTNACRKQHIISCFEDILKRHHRTGLNISSHNDSSVCGAAIDSCNTRKKSFHLEAMLFDCDEDMVHEQLVWRVSDLLAEYCGNECDLASLPRNFENFAFTRTIIKMGKLNAPNKRNRRTSCYFNRLSVDTTEAVCKTFDFQSDLKIWASQGNIL